MDLSAHSESVRVDTIGHSVVTHKKTVGFVVDDGSKADLYVKLLSEKFPSVVVLDRFSVPGGVLVRVGPE